MLTQRPDAIQAFLNRPSAEGDATCLADVLEAPPTREAIAEAIVHAVKATWGVSLEVGSLTPWEIERANERTASHRLA
ncbi:hypothetical protein D3C72_2010780 [compost metagenome]